MTAEPTQKDKQITVEVPEERVAEFYAFFGHFLAGFPGRRRRGHGPRGRRCGTHRGDVASAGHEAPVASAEPETA